MSRLIKTSMSELLSIDNLPTGSVQLLMRRHEMPNKIFAERYWDGKVEKLAYVPESTCRIESKVKVETNGDSYASLEHGRVFVEIEKDGDSPSCPNSWTWRTWLDGEPMDSTCDEKSLHESVSDVITSIDEIISELSVMSEYLKSYDVLCDKLREAGDE